MGYWMRTWIVPVIPKCKPIPQAASKRSITR